MSLQNWLAQGWIQEHRTSPEGIKNLLAVADRDMVSAQVPGLSAEWRLIIAYNSALRSASAVLAASGFRPSKQASHHYYLIESLRLTMGVESQLVTRLDRFRKKRNLSAYEQSGAVSDQEAGEMLSLARELRTRAQEWLEKNHGQLL